MGLLRKIRVKNKLFVLIFSILPLLGFCAQTLFEDKVMECLYKDYTNDALVKVELEDFEKSLVDKDIFVENNQPNYKLILEFIIGLPNQQSIEYPDLDYIDLSSLERNTNDSSICLKNLIEKSNFIDKATFLTYQLILNEFINTHDKVKAAEDMLKLFGESDYKFEVYKLGISSLLIQIDIDSGVKIKLPDIQTNNKSERKPCDDLEIKLTSDNEILFNGKISNLHLLKEAILKHYLDHDEGCISLSAHSNSLYATYIDINKTITEARDFIRDKYSRKMFNMEYENLNSEQQDIIRLKKKFKLKEKDYDK